MALKTIETTIDGLQFHILQFGGMTGLKLEKRILTLLAPLLKALDSIKDEKEEGESILDKSLDMGTLGNIIQDLLLELDDAKLDKLITDLVARTSVNFVAANGQDGGVQPLHKPEIFNDIFAGKNLTILKLLIEIMKANRFAFFELVGGGMLEIDFLKNLGNKKTQQSKLLGRLVN